MQPECGRKKLLASLLITKRDKANWTRRFSSTEVNLALAGRSAFMWMIFCMAVLRNSIGRWWSPSKRHLTLDARKSKAFSIWVFSWNNWNLGFWSYHRRRILRILKNRAPFKMKFRWELSLESLNGFLGKPDSISVSTSIAFVSNSKLPLTHVRVSWTRWFDAWNTLKVRKLRSQDLKTWIGVGS